jgi:uncharacterized protein YndB with AHSA1/START domain/uncharacterized damage-inducible protein DinB
MMSDERKIKQKVVIETTPELAFEALTQASELREWFSDQAWTQVQPEGRYALHWNQGYHVEGKFVELDAPQQAVVTWLGTGEPGETKVKFEIKPGDDGVKVVVIHKGFGPGDEWDKPLEEAEKGWTTGLENLKSTLETGVDLRIARQPFMGILLGLLDAERAAKEGIAVDKGIYVNGTLEDSGARAAGLEKGDVIVAFGDQETPGFQELNTALRAHRAGDVVDVELVRGQERETVKMELGQRPSIDVPETAEGLAELVAERYAEADTELKAALEGLTEEEAEKQPAEGEWSVKQVLAHLSIGERDFQNFLANVAVNGWLDGGPGNTAVIPGRLAAVQASAPTLQALQDRFLADEAETIALLRGLPDETLAHKARYYRIGQFMALGPIHTRDHIEQIENAIQVVRE